MNIKNCFIIVILIGNNCALRNSLKRMDKNAKIFFRKGIKYYENGDFENALDNFNTALKKDSLNPLIQFWRARTYLRLNKPLEADGIFRKALELNPERELKEKIEREILQLSKSEPVIEEEREEEEILEEME